jgi:antitoxin ChpS
MANLKKMDDETRQALSRFKRRLKARYGTRVKSVFLFGSRARGDFRPDSDADVAVFLRHLTDPIREQMAMCDDAYDIWMETGIRIEPWAFEDASLADPEGYRAARLVKTIRREGTPA